MRIINFFFAVYFLTILHACSGTKKVVSNPKNSTEIKVNTKNTSLKEVSLERKKSLDPLPKDSIDQVAETPSQGPFNHQDFDTLLKKHVSVTGQVNYQGFMADRVKLKSYIDSLGKNVPTPNWTKENKLAYWINAYNAMTIDLILRHYPVSSIKDISKPWDQRFWKLGEKWYNLNEIEHDILRKMNEPRIHFAIVCASYSCPNLQNWTFQASNLDAQLTQVTKDFLSDTEKNSISENNLELSKIFQWFAKDFKQNGSLIDFLNQYSKISISESAKKRFKDYNWSLNE